MRHTVRGSPMGRFDTNSVGWRQGLRPVGLLVLAVVIWFAPTEVFAGSKQDYRDCVESADPDRSIEACSRLIDRGDRGSAKKRAEIYCQRAEAYLEKRELDRAIADLCTAIELNPRYALAYTYRGNAYDDKGMTNLAIQDLSLIHI